MDVHCCATFRSRVRRRERYDRAGVPSAGDGLHDLRPRGRVPHHRFLHRFGRVVNAIVREAQARVRRYVGIHHLSIAQNK